MPNLPTGTATFLFTDIEGSTQLWEQHPQAMAHSLAQHHALLREAIEAHGGVVFQIIGDAFCAAFPTAPAALSAALMAQRALRDATWGPTGPLHVRMALHTATLAVQAGDYPSGPHFNRLARLLSAGHGGQILLSLASAELLREHLPPEALLRDLGSHRLKGLGRPEQIFQLVTSDLPTDFPPLRTPETRGTHLPAQLTPLIGRELEVAAVCALLRRTEVRLVTLTGPGGIGKTRLALQAAELLDTNELAPPLPPQRERGLGGEGPRSEGDFPDGVWFVNLAPLSDPGLVASAIAHALGVREVAQQPILDSLKSYLREKRMLLVLDNFEQIVDAAPVVAEVLVDAPGLTVLVTSRMPLRLSGEHEFAVPPLGLPPIKATVITERTAVARAATPTTSGMSAFPVANLTQYEAVRLFIERARAVKAEFAITNENAPAVAEICYRLDGLPLAIELAAGGVKLFSPQALLTRLDQRLKFLTGGARDLPVRQQTIRNTIDWSYALLDAPEQALFRRLGVFVGGCTLEAAEAVCNADGDLPLDVMDGITWLTDKCLLRSEEGANGEPRFLMLGTIREYALERMEQSGEVEVVRRRHADYFLRLAETAEPELLGPAQRMWLDKLEADIDNLRAALAWSLSVQGVATEDSREAIGLALRLATAVGHFWTARNRQREGRTWLERIFERSQALAIALPSLVHAQALSLVGYIATAQTDVDRATTVLEESLALYRDAEDEAGIAEALLYLGRNARMRQDYQRAEQLEVESLMHFRRLRIAWGTALALLSLGDVALEQGLLEHSTAYLQEALALTQDTGLVDHGGWVLYNLGRTAYLQGDYSGALAWLEKGLALFRDLDYTLGVEGTLIELGRAAHAQGYCVQAAQHLIESLALMSEKRFPLSPIADCLDGLAGVAGAQGQPERAVRLFGAAEALRESAGNMLWPAYRTAYDRDVALARAQFDDATFTAAWAAGRAMTLEQAIAYALSDEDRARALSEQEQIANSTRGA
jgi:predicted ATPase/class 3 adenylate cyclase